VQDHVSADSNLNIFGSRMCGKAGPGLVDRNLRLGRWRTGQLGSQISGEKTRCRQQQGGGTAANKGGVNAKLHDYSSSKTRLTTGE
jgi:hypothetical protein